MHTHAHTRTHTPRRDWSAAESGSGKGSNDPGPSPNTAALKQVAKGSPTHREQERQAPSLHRACLRPRTAGTRFASLWVPALKAKKLREAEGSVLGKLTLLKHVAPARRPRANGLRLVLTRMMTRLHQSSCAHTRKRRGAKDSVRPGALRAGLSSRRHLLSQCVVSQSFISQDVHTQVLSRPGQLVAPRYVRVLPWLGLQTTS